MGMKKGGRRGTYIPGKRFYSCYSYKKTKHPTDRLPSWRRSVGNRLRFGG
ncbi:hypothetical protein CHCC20488_0403 [Bacillus paralicheniformis]|nr:hypothetical protein CHCC20347_2420 [Bacillus paralicheniformis]TWK83058.1 hypothetical protein CHCC20333_2016 [Bacillus paralicheniformis]TWN39917.1 hypothetical protein CHCC14523_0008 [Bacillus paralicheniformis]TWN96448.1 hypothetical protein CHCC20488_0403 [Bacillus paralicheniformis]